MTLEKKNPNLYREMSQASRAISKVTTIKKKAREAMTALNGNVAAEIIAQHIADNQRNGQCPNHEPGQQ